MKMKITWKGQMIQYWWTKTTPIKKVSQTKRRSKETLEFKLTKSIDAFPSDTPLELEEERFVIVVTNWEVLNSVSNQIETNYY